MNVVVREGGEGCVGCGGVEVCERWGVGCSLREVGVLFTFYYCTDIGRRTT